MTENEIRELIVEAGHRLIENKLVQGTWGNISVRLDEENMIITPSGMDYKRIKAEDLVKVNINTLEYIGNIKPSSEKELHAAILRKRKDINSVIHSHPSYCCSIAVAKREVPVTVPENKALVGENIKIAQYALPSTKKLTMSSMRAIEGRNGCIMANHGVVACGSDINNAFEVIKAMEASARIFIEETVMKKTGKKIYSDEDLFRLYRNRFF